jgi:hypothetical protein
MGHTARLAASHARKAISTRSLWLSGDARRRDRCGKRGKRETNRRAGTDTDTDRHTETEKDSVRETGDARPRERCCKEEKHGPRASPVVLIRADSPSRRVFLFNRSLKAALADCQCQAGRQQGQGRDRRAAEPCHVCHVGRACPGNFLGSQTGPACQSDQ